MTRQWDDRITALPPGVESQVLLESGYNDRCSKKILPKFQLRTISNLMKFIKEYLETTENTYRLGRGQIHILFRLGSRSLEGRCQHDPCLCCNILPGRRSIPNHLCGSWMLHLGTGWAYHCPMGNSFQLGTLLLSRYLKLTTQFNINKLYIKFDIVPDSQ